MASFKRRGGLLIFDDLTIHCDINPPEASVKAVGDSFLTSFQNEFNLIHLGVRQFVVQKRGLVSQNYITTADHLFFDWGNHASLRKVMDIKTWKPVELSQKELDTLAQCLLRRPSGAINATLDDVDPTMAESLMEKVPTFFKVPTCLDPPCN